MTCDHKFVDSKACLKCGWVPPPRAPKTRVDWEKHFQKIADDLLEQTKAGAVFVIVVRPPWDDAAVSGGMAGTAALPLAEALEHVQALVYYLQRGECLEPPHDEQEDLKAGSS